MASFFRQFNAIGPLFCSFVQHHQLELRTSRHTRNIRTSFKTKIETSKTRSPLVISTRIFFGTMRLFLKFFGFHKTLRLFRLFLQHNGYQKSQRVPLLHFLAL